jgi:hypothetical protein
MMTHSHTFGWNLLSAKGAAFISQPGAMPQDRRNRKFPALKARFTFRQFQKARGCELNRAFSADRHCNRMPGTLPQAKADVAPLALNKR